MVYNWLISTLSKLYPDSCLLCGAGETEQPGFCSDCLLELPYNLSFCYQCALPLPLQTPGKSLCGACQKSTPHFDRCFAPLHYTQPTNSLVGHLKFNGKLHIREGLSRLMGDFIDYHQETLPELIIPVPLHPRRLGNRGYNQALELARPLARRFQIPIDSHSCKRIKATSTQTSLKKQERKRNLKEAFTVSEQLVASHVALVDDVITTGSTLSELARVLKRQGVKRVDAWAVARTP
ncbi:MAG: ComF family protein [Candidatus Sedimenticola sp. (ex Thyasira tokunagai)]